MPVEQKLLYAARARAKKRGLSFELKLSDIVIPPTCPVLGIPIAAGHSANKTGPAASAPTLDRINPALGYVPGNVAVISWRANRLKSDATLAELRAVTTWVESVTP